MNRLSTLRYTHIALGLLVAGLCVGGVLSWRNSREVRMDSEGVENNTGITEDGPKDIRGQLIVPETDPSSSVIPSLPASWGGNPLSNVSLYRVPDSVAIKQVASWQESRAEDAVVLQKLAAQPMGIWLTKGQQDIAGYVRKIMNESGALVQDPLLVVYNIPLRSCDSGGADSAGEYRDWIDAIVPEIGARAPVVVLEPDAVPQWDCLPSDADRQQRQELLLYAVKKIKSETNAYVYIDAGHSKWLDAKIIAERLVSVGVGIADGFSLNVSNFQSDTDTQEYGQKLSKHLNGAHFVIDSSRNGRGPTQDQQWCNPSGRALGSTPTVNTDEPLVDAYLWIKYPGESDGSCNGGPSEGQWWPEYALELARNAQ